MADIKGDFPQGVIGPFFNDRFGDVFGNIYAFTSDGLSQRQLRDRVEDIGLLADHFLTLFSTEMDVAKPSLTPRALALLESHPFPGNVRELKNLLDGDAIF